MPAKPEAPAGTAPIPVHLPGAPRTAVALSDHLDIECLVKAFAVAIDYRDWDLFGNLFTETVDVNLDPRTAPSPPAPVPVAAWVPVARKSFEPYDSTHHLLSVDAVTVHGDTAEALTHFQASHFLANPDGAPTFVQKGMYVHSCRRTPEGWRISGWRQEVRWGTGNRAILDYATGG